MLCLDHLTAWELDPPSLIRAAAATKYDAVSMWFRTPPMGADLYPMLGDTPMRRETQKAVRETGVSVFSVGLFALTPDGASPEWEGMLESGATLAAKRGIVLVYDPDKNRRRDVLARLVERARNYQIGLDVELVAGSALSSIAEAAELATDAGGDTGLILDPLHLKRTGGVPADIEKIDPALIRYAQLCDGAETVAPENWLYEGSQQRMLPGDGAFPLRDFVATFPPGLPVGLEIPLADLAAQGHDAAARSRIARDAAMPFLQAYFERT